MGKKKHKKKEQKLRGNKKKKWSKKEEWHKEGEMRMRREGDDIKLKQNKKAIKIEGPRHETT